jgi:non-specific protein-tyrosine kinase
MMEQVEFGETSISSADIMKYVYLLWKWAWLILLVSIVTGISAFFISRQQTPVYQAATTIMINEAASSKTTDYNSVLTSEQLTQTYSKMIDTQPVLIEVGKRLGIVTTTKEFKNSITVKSVQSTQLIEIAVESTDPGLAANIANTIVTVFSEQLSKMQSDRFSASMDSLKSQMTDLDNQINDLSAQSAKTVDKTEKDRLEDKITQYRQIYSQLSLSYEQVRLTEAQTISTVVQVEPAVTPTEPVRPKVFQNTFIAFIVGMFLSIGVIFLIETLDDTIRDPEALVKRYGLSILGVIAHHDQQEGAPISIRHPSAPVTEAFRSLRTNVEYASVDKPIRSLLITSPTPGDGKSTVTANLAVVLAQGGKRVYLLDADLRRPTIHHIMGTHNWAGLSSLFVQPEVHLNGTATKTKSGVSVLSSGNLPPNPAELLGSKKMREILGAVLDECDVAIIDTPPVLAVTDAVVLSHLVDGVLLVIKPGKTQEAAFRQAVEQLSQPGINLLGVVINSVGTGSSYYNYHYRKYYKNQYGYSYGEESGKKDHKKKKPAEEKEVAAQVPAAIQSIDDVNPHSN